MAISSPLLETSINGAHGVLVNVTGSWTSVWRRWRPRPTWCSRPPIPTRSLFLAPLLTRSWRMRSALPSSPQASRREKTAVCRKTPSPQQRGRREPAGRRAWGRGARGRLRTRWTRTPSWTFSRFSTRINNGSGHNVIRMLERRKAAGGVPPLAAFCPCNPRTGGYNSNVLKIQNRA